MDNQDYVAIAYENIEGILHLYNEHKDKHPVMLFDVQERHPGPAEKAVRYRGDQLWQMIPT